MSSPSSAAKRAIIAKRKLCETISLNRGIGSRSVGVHIEATKCGRPSRVATLYCNGSERGFYSPMQSLAYQLREAAIYEEKSDHGHSVDPSEVSAQQPSKIADHGRDFASGRKFYVACMKRLESLGRGRAIRVWRAWRAHGYFAMFEDSVLHLWRDASGWHTESVPKEGVALPVPPA